MFGRKKPVIEPLNAQKSVAKPAGGIAVATIIAAGLLIEPWENGVNSKPHLVPYLDSGSVPTACTGATGPEITAAFRSGKVFTENECKKIDARNLKIQRKSA